MIDTSSRLLMSEEIQGMVPQLEDDAFQKFEDAFIVGVLEIALDDSPLVGNITGLAIDDNVKFDFRVSLSSAYSVITRAALGKQMTCTAYQLHLGDDTIRVPGPYTIQSPRMIDIDHSTKMCVLAVDLIKICP